MESMVTFLIPTLILVVFWIIMFQKRMTIPLLISFVLGLSVIIVFVEWWINNVVNDPCAGVPDCMNESGMVFVLALMGITGILVFTGITVIVSMILKNRRQ